jgi:hypothetical protein
MNTGMTFNDGPMISGHWYNAKTGDSFTVKDTYFEDNNLYVLTTDGRRLNYDMFSRYVQTEKPMPKQQPKTQVQHDNTLPPEVAKELSKSNDIFGEDLLTDEDLALLNKPLSKQNQTVQVATTDAIQLDEDALLIKRMLDRATVPNVDCKVSWSKFPLKQMDMLDTMGVDHKRIADYYINKLNIDEIRAIISGAIVKYIETGLSNITNNDTLEIIPPEKAPARKPASKRNVQTKKK